MFSYVVFLLLAVVSVSARAMDLSLPRSLLQFLPHMPSSTVQCSFSPPSAPLSPAKTYAQVPAAAWPVISKLLHSSLVANSQANAYAVQTFNLGSEPQGEDFEGVMLSVMYGAMPPTYVRVETEEGERVELKRREIPVGDVDMQECLSQAAQGVEKVKMMEGSMEVDRPNAPTGMVNFLVYRVD
ncbi:uncharacterized protein BP5553_05296 [Venustampulla echinocandica]|uniref:Uncharacterized protein n=1 Tax=Venustampulla echinocandica TaxID=2656787 RepID=A0A370TQR5_9HELO|nr:uncharacterized protein BP5553_05296 [Venustampulla echinocandica]RDL37863.1 hypothetical protein BP5553_05296 [Venustampulla echinocandica]